MPLRIATLLLLAAVAGAEGWPFGGGQGPFSARDLWNLGLVGAKASDADKPPPANTPPSGRRQVRLEPGVGNEGPERLRIELLYPGGPAEKAGLQTGDVVVGAGSKRFKEGSLEQLAKALLKAEASPKGELTLLVERGGKGKAEKVVVTLPPGGREAGKPTEGKGRRALLDGALKWLADRQQEDGGYVETLSGKNGAVVQAALAGLAWLGAGSDLESGPYSANVRLAAAWVGKNVRDLDGEIPGREPGGPSWNQSNWGVAHAAIFLGELHARTPDRQVLDDLTWCAQRLVDTQEKSGGWAHGPGGKNALGYLELNIVTGLALSGLGCAKRNGFAVPEDTLQRAEAYLEASSGGGGVGYSDQPGQKGSGNIGRTAGCWLGYQALGLGKAKFAKSMESFAKREAGNVLGGHASLMQHVLLAGVAAPALGSAARKDFWESCEPSFVLARAPDGSFQPRPWHETIGMGSNSDVSFGEVWTTAAWAIVLASEKTKDGVVGYPVWTGE